MKGCGKIMLGLKRDPKEFNICCGDPIVDFISKDDGETYECIDTGRVFICKNCLRNTSNKSTAQNNKDNSETKINEEKQSPSTT